MDAKEVREWKARYDAAEQWIIEEKRTETPQLRLARVERMLNWLYSIGRGPEPERDMGEHFRWSEIQEKVLEFRRSADARS